MKQEFEDTKLAWESGAYTASYDFGHTSIEWDGLLELGITGLLKRIQNAKDAKIKDATLTYEQEIFYDSSEIVYKAILRFFVRLSEAIKKKAVYFPKDQDRMLLVASSLKNLSCRPPETLHEALQLIYIYHIIQENMEGERLRSLGGLDRLCLLFYKADITANRYNKSQLKQLLKYFMFKFYTLTTDTLYGQPFYMGGVLEDGSDALNEMSWLILQAFDELSVPNPKIHIRVNEKTPKAFLSYVADCIRRGNSSLLLINDDIAISALMGLNIPESHARNYVTIGCYEPAVEGLEIACTGNAAINLAKAVELAIHNGIDPLSGNQIGIRSGNLEAIKEFDDFYRACKSQITYMLDKVISTIIKYESHYMQMNPSPLFSATLNVCVKNGKDAYAGGNLYNNSSITALGLGSFADQLCAIKEIIFDKKTMSFKELQEILDNNWEGYENLRLSRINSNEKWGNNLHIPDKIAKDISEFIYQYAGNKPNGRGGVFRLGLFSIDHNFHCGIRMGATPEGRFKGQELSKNIGAATAMDRRGVTGCINSICKIDHTHFANGTAYDIVMHPSAVQGDKGLETIISLWKTYFAKGGMAVHMNIFEPNILKKAQKNPEKYATLQVRVCGWNVYFINLSKEEQDSFIKQAESIVS